MSYFRIPLIGATPSISHSSHISSTLGRFPSDGASMRLESPACNRHSWDTLQVLPTFERPILVAIFHDLLGMVLINALNAGKFLFGCGVQIKVCR